MISGIDLNATEDFILKDDTDNPTVWKLGIIPGILHGRIRKELIEDEVTTLYKMLQVAIKGWENYTSPFETHEEKLFGQDMEVAPLSLITTIPVKAINEISMKVLKINRVGDLERKN